MLLGLYPPGKNNYVLEESQKYNAIPPVEGFDFTPWIEEMGLEALPHQTTVFPIQMNGWSYDYMLALDDDNCPKRGKARSALTAQLKNESYAIADKTYPGAKTYFDKYGWSDFCNYMSWAYLESVELKPELANQTDKLYSTCQACLANEVEKYSQLELSSLKGLSSNEIRKHLNNTVYFW
mmetsp:Transcript_39710/g.60855  ORF Transcript_39710/g.60855 Transcript_39710/m.60855 type:complete len:180 (+) Transcript_39710:364-903(+)